MKINRFILAACIALSSLCLLQCASINEILKEIAEAAKNPPKKEEPQPSPSPSKNDTTEVNEKKTEKHRKSVD
jgi:hypothetical protein